MRDIKEEKQAEISNFFDKRVKNYSDLNYKSAPENAPAYHHSGLILNLDTSLECLDLKWLRRSEEQLTDWVWQQILNHLESAPKKVLDIGAGEGATLIRFHKLSNGKSLKTTGISISEKQMEVAQKSFPKGIWITDDVTELDDIKDSPYDVIMAIEMTEYLGKEGLETLMQKVNKWLKNDGIFVIISGSISNTADSSANSNIIKMFNSFYKTNILKTSDYLNSCEDTDLSLVEEISLNEEATKYWNIRAQNSLYWNSPGGLLEKLISKVLRNKSADYKAYFYRRTQNN